MKGRKTLSWRRTALRHEPLESRAMLAVVTGDSAWQNPLDANDLNCDGAVSAGDALVAINAINEGTGGALSSKVAPPMLAGRVKTAASNFLDVDGDQQLAAGDALAIINAVNQRLHRTPAGDLPTDDQQPDTPGASAQTLDLTHSFAKLRALINTAGDVDVFQVKPTKAELNVALFSAGGGALSVTITDEAGTVLGTATTEDGSFRPAKADATVEVNQTYFVTVKGAAGVTGLYGLAVLNFDDRDFSADADSPPGTDIHGQTTATATALSLANGHASVRSNIDAAGDIDMFAMDAVDGKLVVETGAEFALNIKITDAAGNALPTIVSTRHVTVANVTAGTYYVSVAAANGTDTGAYHLHVVNAALRAPDDRPDHLPKSPTREDIFARLDADDSDGLSLAEFKGGVPLGRTRLADHVFANWDTDDNDSLSLDEFVAGLSKLPALIPHGNQPEPGTALLTAR